LGQEHGRHHEDHPKSYFANRRCTPFPANSWLLRSFLDLYRNVGPVNILVVMMQNGTLTAGQPIKVEAVGLLGPELEKG
jgi:hypothetical protein